MGCECYYFLNVDICQNMEFTFKKIANFIPPRIDISCSMFYCLIARQASNATSVPKQK